MPDLRAPDKLVILLLCLGSLSVWGVIIARWRRGEPALALTPREPCRWHPAAVGLALPVSTVVQYVVVARYLQEDPLSIAGVQARCLATILEILVLMGMLALGTPIRAKDFGIDPARFGSDVLLGGAGFLASFAPVCALNLLVDRLGWRAEGAKHPLFLVLEQRGANATAGWIILGAAILAPVAEELLYRVILQGWLETRLSPRAAILFVATLFAFVHFGKERPDHIPLFPLALILGYVYWRRHSYLAVVVLHAAFNATNLALALFFGDG
jgi:membrane protease YdiL (CAAX protease family)